VWDILDLNSQALKKKKRWETERFLVKDLEICWNNYYRFKKLSPQNQINALLLKPRCSTSEMLDVEKYIFLAHFFSSTVMCHFVKNPRKWKPIFEAFYHGSASVKVPDISNNRSDSISIFTTEKLLSMTNYEWEDFQVIKFNAKKMFSQSHKIVFFCAHPEKWKSEWECMHVCQIKYYFKIMLDNQTQSICLLK